MEKKPLGRYIVADPAICHGEPTFRGTRILVSDVLEQVASGMAWEAIVEEWRGKPWSPMPPSYLPNCPPYECPVTCSPEELEGE